MNLFDIFLFQLSHSKQFLSKACKKMVYVLLIHIRPNYGTEDKKRKGSQNKLSKDQYDWSVGKVKEN